MLFDTHIRQVTDFVAGMAAAGRRVKTVTVRVDAGQLAAGVRVGLGPGAGGGLILRGDTFVELGNPEAGSAGMLLWTPDCALVSDGRITLVGPDIPESPGASLPFAQVVLVGAPRLGPSDYPALNRAGIVADAIGGYMVRTATRSPWSRVGRVAVERGFDFAMLGRALMWLNKRAQPDIEAIEILFVTSCAEDVGVLAAVAADAGALAREVVRDDWKAKGVDLDCGLDCSSCSDRAVCDDIRAVVAARQGAQEGGVECPAL